VGHKNVSFLFFTITLVSLDMDFYTLCTSGNRNVNTPQNRQKIHNNFTVTVSSIAAMGSTVRDKMTVAGGFLRYVRSNRLCATFAQKVVQWLSFQLLLEYSSMSLRVSLAAAAETCAILENTHSTTSANFPHVIFNSDLRH